MVRWKGRFGPFDLEVSEHTFVPSTLSMLLADVLEVRDGDEVIDMGCGSGILSIVAAKLGAARVIGVDLAADVVEVASRNAARQGVAEVTTFLHGDLFEPLPREVRADVIIGDVSGIPDPLAVESGWFPGGRGGGARGSELPIRMLRAARERLRSGGRLFLPTGSLQDEGAILRTARALYGKLTRLTEREIPLPRPLAETAAVVKLAKDRIVQLREKGSRLLWTARVWECSTA
ncbi:MAG: 50S ribosomal protein L11 methyltransferase [Actinomycetota bacterium]